MTLIAAVLGFGLGVQGVFNALDSLDGVRVEKKRRLDEIVNIDDVSKIGSRGILKVPNLSVPTVYRRVYAEIVVPYPDWWNYAYNPNYGMGAQIYGSWYRKDKLVTTMHYNLLKGKMGGTFVGPYRNCKVVLPGQLSAAKRVRTIGYGLLNMLSAEVGDPYKNLEFLPLYKQIGLDSVYYVDNYEFVGKDLYLHVRRDKVDQVSYDVYGSDPKLVLDEAYKDEKDMAVLKGVLYGLLSVASVVAMGIRKW